MIMVQHEQQPQRQDEETADSQIDGQDEEEESRLGEGQRNEGHFNGDHILLYCCSSGT